MKPEPSLVRSKGPNIEQYQKNIIQIKFLGSELLPTGSTLRILRFPLGRK